MQTISQKTRYPKSASAPNWKTSAALEFFCHSQNSGWSFTPWKTGGKGLLCPFWKPSLESSARKPCGSWVTPQILLTLELVWPHFLPKSFCCLLSSDSCEHRFFWVVPWATFLEPNVLVSPCLRVQGCRDESRNKNATNWRPKPSCFPGLKEKKKNHLNTDTSHLEHLEQRQGSKDHLKFGSKRRS